MIPGIEPQKRNAPGQYAGKFGFSGKMRIKPYSISDEDRPKVLRSFNRYAKISLCGCWEWTGRVHNGYGVCSTPSSSRWAHRVSYALFNGNIMEDMHIDHVCRNKTCVNPAHLKMVLPHENYAAVHRRKLRDIKRQREERGQLKLW